MSTCSYMLVINYYWSLWLNKNGILQNCCRISTSALLYHLDKTPGGKAVGKLCKDAACYFEQILKAALPIFVHVGIIIIIMSRCKYSHTIIHIYIYIYIYCHPQTDCFVLSELFSVARHAGRSKLGSKPVQLYVRLSSGPVGHQADYVGYICEREVG